MKGIAHSRRRRRTPPLWRISSKGEGLAGDLGRLLTLALTIAAMASIPAFAAGRVYSGGVSQTAILEGPSPRPTAPDPNAMAGVVTDAASGRPLAGAVVSAPSLGRWTRTGADGAFSLGPAPPGRRLILNIVKTGFQPESLTLEGGVRAQGPLRARLRQMAGALVIDNEWRHLGDNRYSARSAGASSFRLSAGGSSLRLGFSTHGIPLRGAHMLRIGAVLGLDTAAAHLAGQSDLSVFSSPARILINGYPVGQLALNGSSQAFAVPGGVIRPNDENTLEIQAGWQLPATEPVDFDDFELMTILLTL